MKKKFSITRKVKNMSQCEQENSICGFMKDAIIEAEKKCIDGETKRNFVIEKMKNIISNTEEVKKNFLAPIFLNNPLIVSIIIKVIIMIINQIMNKDWIKNIDDLERK